MPQFIVNEVAQDALKLSETYFALYMNIYVY